MSPKILNRTSAIFLLIIFSLTQSIPAGWSADSVATNEQGIQQPVVPVDAHIPGNPNVDISPTDPTSEFLDGRTVTVPDERPEEKEEKPVPILNEPQDTPLDFTPVGEPQHDNGPTQKGGAALY